ncbi:MAG: type II toxin-antitoxin system VapB family antitoxin [Euzebya sp.]
MSDLLIRDVPEDVVSTIDARAKRMGISRSEYLRRALLREARVLDGPVAVEDFIQFGHRFSDLGDPAVMGAAWS